MCYDAMCRSAVRNSLSSSPHRHGLSVTWPQVAATDELTEEQVKTIEARFKEITKESRGLMPVEGLAVVSSPMGTQHMMADALLPFRL